MGFVMVMRVFVDQDPSTLTIRISTTATTDDAVAAIAYTGRSIDEACNVVRGWLEGTASEASES